jgi:hypothetical protein
MSLATDMVAFYITAEKAVLAGQSVQFGERRLTYANLEEIRAGRAEWERKVADEARSAAGDKSPVRFAVASFTESP